jgi:hypothetical protein
MATVSNDGVTYRDECDEAFISYSVSSIVREQAKSAGWDRPKAGRVKWPGSPPCENAKKVDLCPKHAKLVMTDAELKAAKEARKAERKVARELARAERKAEKRRAAKTRRGSNRKKKTAPAEATA